MKRKDIRANTWYLVDVYWKLKNPDDWDKNEPEPVLVHDLRRLRGLIFAFYGSKCRGKSVESAYVTYSLLPDVLKTYTISLSDFSEACIQKLDAPFQFLQNIVAKDE